MTKSNLQHIGLQALACSMLMFNRADAMHAFQLCNLRSTDINNYWKPWQDENIILSYSGDTKYKYINPEYWVDIIKSIDENNLAIIENGCFTSFKYAHTSNFVKAMLNFFNGKPYIKQFNLLHWDILLNSAIKLMYFDKIMHRGDCADFADNLPEYVLGMLFEYKYSNGWRNNISTPINYDFFDKYYFSNKNIHPESRGFVFGAYVFYIDFLRGGKLDEAIAKLPEKKEYWLQLSAIKCLHEGNPAKAADLFKSALKLIKQDFFYDQFTNFLYGIALGLSTLEKHRKTAEKFLSSRKLMDSGDGGAMLIVLHHYIKGDAEKVLAPISKHTTDPIEQALITYFGVHFNLIEQNSVLAKAAVDYIKKQGYIYLKRLYADDFAELQSMRKQLIETTGITNPLLPNFTQKQNWEVAIETIERISTVGSEKKQKTASKERIAYFINQHYEIQPKLQVSKDGVTWSSGRNIALKKLKDNAMSVMSDTDYKVAANIQHKYGWNGDVYYIDNGATLLALAGYPLVFDEETGQKIDIEVEPLQLTVTPNKDGFDVKCNVKYGEVNGDFKIFRKGDKQITIIPIDNCKMQIIKTLDEIKSFPKESQGKLTSMLEKLSGQFTVMSPLLKNSETLKRIDSVPLTVVQIAPLITYPPELEDLGGPLYSVNFTVKPFGDNPPYQIPGEGMELVSTTINGERVQTERDLKAEKKNLTAVRKLMSNISKEEYGDNQWYLDTGRCLALLDGLREMQENAVVEWPQGVKMRVLKPQIQAQMLRLNVNSVGQWFEIEGELRIGEKEKIKIAQLLESLRNAEGNFIRLGDDEYVAISEQLRRQLLALAQMTDNKGKKLKVAQINGMQFSELEKLGVDFTADKGYVDLINRIKESAKKTFKVPANLHAELRPYQEEGFRWMSRLAHWGAGGCLADDMGLGKTVQAIALMLNRAKLGPQLVIMPTNVLVNWQQELDKFAPALSVKVLNQGDRKAMVEAADAGDVVICTYGLLVTETELLTSRVWTTIVLDEAHAIKNRDTQTSKGAMMLQGDFRLLLTGTPLQNHLSEIWNLFQFANPGLLGTFQQFTDRFILPVERDHDRERQRLLRTMLSPFMLRRTKEDVLNELPEKTEITLRVELSDEEQALYDNLRQQAIVNIEEGKNAAFQALAEITKLRQAACNPRLINPKLKIQSSKAQAFINLVRQLHLGGHRALVFSQFTKHLALIREELDKLFNEGISYLYMDGSTSANERSKLVRQFQTGDDTLFLISLKAGGVGLNLTAADYVIHLDPWWNPAIEDQASDRAHRMGQDRPVTVYRMITAGTIEEKIIRLHQNKRSMADALLQDANLFSQINAEEVIKLLKESAEMIK